MLFVLVHDDDGKLKVVPIIIIWEIKLDSLYVLSNIVEFGYLMIIFLCLEIIFCGVYVSRADKCYKHLLVVNFC